MADDPTGVRPEGRARRPSIGARSTSRPQTSVFSMGYQGRSQDEFLQVVRGRSIEQVIDVRENPWSRKPGFAATDLKTALAGIGVSYVHLPELGCRSGSRHALWAGGPAERFQEDYRHELEGRPGAFRDLVQRVRASRTLLLCLERDPSRCHRAVLAEKLHSEGIATQEL